MIKEIDVFLQEDAFTTIVNYIRSTEDWTPSSSALWDRRCIGAHHISDQKAIDAVFMLKDKALSELVATFEIEAPLYVELFNLVRTFDSTDTTPHSDSSGNSGEDNGTSHRVYSSLLYLNDDFTGGNIWFPNQNLEISPAPNKFITFNSDFEHLHGVKAVSNGVRYNITMFWTHDKEKAFQEPFFNRSTHG